MIELGFNGNLNTSLDIGDTVYAVYPTTTGTNSINSSQFSTAVIPEPSNANPVVVGTVTKIETNNIINPYYTDGELTVITDPGTTDQVTTVVNTVIYVQEPGPTVAPTTSAFYFFSKDNKYNMSSLTGYYGDVKFRNNSTEKAELFATSVDVTQSSK
jgi:hypothetical protein